MSAISPAVRPRLADLPASSRSKIANGRYGFSLRTVQGRRWRDVFISAMEGTGAKNEQLCRAYASLVVRRESLDAEVASGEPVDVDLLLRCTSEVRRLQERLGLIVADADDEPGEDGTAAAIAALRSARRPESAKL